MVLNVLIVKLSSVAARRSSVATAVAAPILIPMKGLAWVAAAVTMNRFAPSLGLSGRNAMRLVRAEQT